MMLKTEDNPGGLPIEVFDEFCKALADNRTEFDAAARVSRFFGQHL